MKYLEVVAFMQSKWESLSLEEKAPYSMICNEKLKELEKVEMELEY
jgi:hypothetical protein